MAIYGEFHKEMGVYPKQWIMEIKDVVTLTLGSQPK